MRKIAYKQVLVKKAQADWLKTVQNWAKEAPSWWNQFTSENRWARPVIYGLGGSLLAGLATGGMSNSFARLLTILLSGGSLAALGAHHNTQQDIQNISKHTINTLSKRLDDYVRTDNKVYDPSKVQAMKDAVLKGISPYYKHKSKILADLSAAQQSALSSYIKYIKDKPKNLLLGTEKPHPILNTALKGAQLNTQTAAEVNPYIQDQNAIMQTASQGNFGASK